MRREADRLRCSTVDDPLSTTGHDVYAECGRTVSRGAGDVHLRSCFSRPTLRGQREPVRTAANTAPSMQPGKGRAPYTRSEPPAFLSKLTPRQPTEEGGPWRNPLYWLNCSARWVTPRRSSARIISATAR